MEYTVTHIFSAKIPVTWIVYLLEQLFFFTTNELVKLTMLWTTGSSFLSQAT